MFTTLTEFSHILLKSSSMFQQMHGPSFALACHILCSVSHFLFIGTCTEFSMYKCHLSKPFHSAFCLADTDNYNVCNQLQYKEIVHSDHSVVAHWCQAQTDAIPPFAQAHPWVMFLALSLPTPLGLWSQSFLSLSFIFKYLRVATVKIASGLLT